MAGRLVSKEQSALHKPEMTNAQKYPKYFRDVKELDSVDTYEINRLFPVKDDSGAIYHARKKLLIPGSRTGGKSMYEDIREARDTLNRWLEMHKP